MILVASTENNEEFAMVWSGSSSGAVGSWGDGILLHSAASQDSHTDVNVIFEESSTHDGIVVFASASANLQYVVWQSGSKIWTGAGSIDPPTGVANCNINFTDIAADPASANVLVGVTCGTYGWTIRLPDLDNKILHATDLVGGNHLALSVAYEKASFLFNNPVAAQALVVFSRANLNNIYFRRLGFNGTVITNTTDFYGRPTDCPMTDPGGCEGPLLDKIPNTLRLSANTATKDIALMVQDDGNDIYFVRFDGQFSVSKILEHSAHIYMLYWYEKRLALPARVIRDGCLDSFHITQPNSTINHMHSFLSLLCCLNNRTDLFTISSGELF